MSPPCQFYINGFMYINLNYIITTLKSCISVDISPSQTGLDEKVLVCPLKYEKKLSTHISFHENVHIKWESWFKWTQLGFIIIELRLDLDIRALIIPRGRTSSQDPNLPRFDLFSCSDHQQKYCFNLQTFLSNTEVPKHCSKKSNLTKFQDWIFHYF